MTTPSEKRLAQIRQQADQERLQLLTRMRNGVPEVSPVLRNALIYLNVDEKIKGLFRYNSCKYHPEIVRNPPWESTLGDYPKSVDDADVLALKVYFINTYRVEFPTTMVGEAIDYSAHCNKFDPVKDYLLAQKWDGKPRVQRWLTEYMGVEDCEYARFVGTMTLAAACHRVDKPGVKYDHMLIIEGAQGVGKSMAVSILGGEFYREVSLIDHTKETVENMQGSWINEVAELAVFKRREIESLKAFITCTSDNIRLPFGHRSKMFPRRSIFIGTINPDNNGYLSDTTGNRRFIIVKSEGNVDLKGLARDRNQLWAEAWQIYQKGFPMYIESGSEVEKVAREKQMLRETSDEWQSLIASHVENMERIRSIDIWVDCLKGCPKDFDRFRQIRVADCMAKLGWEKSVMRFDGKSSNGYHRKMSKTVETDTTAPWDE